MELYIASKAEPIINAVVKHVDDGMEPFVDEWVRKEVRQDLDKKIEAAFYKVAGRQSLIGLIDDQQTIVDSLVEPKQTTDSKDQL